MARYAQQRIGRPGRRLGALCDGTSAVLSLVLATVLCVLSVRAGWATPLAGDAAQEVWLAPPPLVPQLGPRYAVVTVDVSGTLGGTCPAGLLRSLVRRQPQLGDVRVRFLPLRSGGERGAELWTAACGERPAQCFPLLLELCEHPEWLSPGAQTALGVSSTPTVPGELSEELWRAVARHGFDPASLRESLRTHRTQRQLAAMWASARGNRQMPEVLVNDRRVVGAQLELRVMDEIDAARLRAHDMLKNGTPLTRLYEQLQTTPDDDRRRLDVIWGSGLLDPQRDIPNRPLRVHLDGVPCQGPQIAPTTLVLFFHHESFPTGVQTRAVLDAVARFRDKVRLCVLHAPLLPAARRTSELIAQTAAVDPRLFFRLLEDVADLMTRRFVLRYDDVVQLLRKRGELGKVEAASARGRNQVMSDVAELQRLGLRPGMWLIIDGKVWSNWSTEALAQALLQKTQQGFFSRLKKNLATPP